MNTRIRFFSLLLILVALCGCAELSEGLITPGDKPEDGPPSYTNPLLDKELVWDPAVIFDGTSYYLYSTEETWNPADWGDDIRPEMGIFKSSDMIRWEHIGEVIPVNPLWHRGLDAFKFDDKFYIYALTDVGEVASINVYESLKANSGFTLKGSISFPPSLILNTDSFTNFIIDGDKQYVTLKGAVNDGTNDIWGIYLVEMTDVLNFKPGTEPILLSDWTHSDNLRKTLQNPTIIKNEDSYFLITKNDDYWAGTGVLKVLKSDAITGPYTDSAGGKEGNTMLEPADPANQVNGISSLMKDANGDSWIYYSVGVAWGARLYLDKVLWDGNGFPYIKDKLPSTTKQEVIPNVTAN